MVNLPSQFSSLPDASSYLEPLIAMRERILADTVMIAEIPAPTFGEQRVVRFLADRFTEEDLDGITTDQAGNATAILPGRTGKRNILLAAHVDRIWEATVDHTVTVSADTIVGPGIADNALGVAALTTFPSLLNRLGVQLDANLILLGTSRSMGRGDLAGLRFFCENAQLPIGAAICVEGIECGRLSYSSLGMSRCEIEVHVPEERDWESWSLYGAINPMNRIIERILRLSIPQVPKSSVILGSVHSGTSYNVPPTRANLRLEIRSEEPGTVSELREQIGEIVEEIKAEQRVEATLIDVARRRPGTIGFSHPLVRGTRAIMQQLNITPTIAPSTSELSVLLDRGIPSLTLGLTSGDNKHHLNETIRIEPIFRGLAQLIASVQLTDQYLREHE